MESRKIQYLDGLRGIAAFMVVLSHFTVGFFPALYFGNTAITHIRNAGELYISGSWLNLFYNGNFAVCIFFVLSGFVLSKKFFIFKDNEILTSSAVKRYFRLMLPVSFSIFAAFFLMKLSLFHNREAGIITGSSWLQSYWAFVPHFMDALKDSLFGTFIKNTSEYNDVLWTIVFELYGSFLVFGFLAFFGKVKNRFFFYAIAIILLSQTYYLAFILGILLCDLTINCNGTTLKKFDKSKVLRAFLFILGLFLGSYPTGRSVGGTIYEFFNYFKIANPYILLHILGAFFVMLALLNSNRLQSFFSNKYLLFLGKISFSMYLIHLIIIGSFSSYLFVRLFSVFSYRVSFVATFALSLPFIFLVSYLIYRYIDKNAMKYSQLLYEKLFKK